MYPANCRYFAKMLVLLILPNHTGGAIGVFFFLIHYNLCYHDDSNKNIPNLHFTRGVIPGYFPIGGYAKLIYPLSFLLFLGRIQVLVLEIYFFRV